MKRGIEDGRIFPMLLPTTADSGSGRKKAKVKDECTYVTEFYIRPRSDDGMSDDE